MAINKNTAMLREGSSGGSVKDLQKALQKAGYDVGKSGADGIFGTDTAKAVKQYQQDNGLAVDGIAGKNTLNALATTETASALAPGLIAGAQIAAGTKPTTLTNNNKSNTNSNKSNTTTTTTGTPKASETPNANTATETPKTADPAPAPTTTQSAPFTYDEFAYDKEFSYDDFSYGDFTYDPYSQSDLVQQANAMLQQQMNSKPGEYQSQWQDQIDSALDAYNNRDPFSYDFNSDALYQQYKDNYIQQGQMAMMDTMGQAAAMTGGYGNSYAQSVGQQAYNQQLSQLNDVMPQLYQMAYDRYDQEGTDLYNQYNMLLARENKDYSRYQDNLNNWYSELEYLTNRYETERQLDYNQWQTNRDLAYDQYTADRNLAYNAWSDGRAQAYDEYTADKNLAYNEYSDGKDLAWKEYLANQEKEQAAAELMAGVGNYDRLGDVYGLTDEELGKIEAANKPKSSGVGTKPVTYKSITHDDLAKMQNQIGKAGSTADLATIARTYVAMGYDPDVIADLTAGKQLSLKGNTQVDTTVSTTNGSGTNNLPKGNTTVPYYKNGMNYVVK